MNGNMFKRRRAVQEQFPESKCKTQDISKVGVCFDIEVSTQIIIFGIRYAIRSLYLSRCIHLLSLLIDGMLHRHPAALPCATLMALPLKCVLHLCSNEPRTINCSLYATTFQTSS